MWRFTRNGSSKVFTSRWKCCSGRRMDSGISRTTSADPEFRVSPSCITAAQPVCLSASIALMPPWSRAGCQRTPLSAPGHGRKLEKGLLPPSRGEKLTRREFINLPHISHTHRRNSPRLTARNVLTRTPRTVDEVLPPIFQACLVYTSRSLYSSVSYLEL